MPANSKIAKIFSAPDVKHGISLFTSEEIEELAKAILKDITRTKLSCRLTLLRAEGETRGKFIRPGKGIWVW